MTGTLLAVRLQRRQAPATGCCCWRRTAGSPASTRRATPVAVEKNAAVLDEMWASLTVERPDRYPVRGWKAFDASLGVPESWRQTREFSGGGTTLVQFASPPLGDGQAPDDPRRAVGHARARSPAAAACASTTTRPASSSATTTWSASHQAFRGGFVDIMKTETPLAVSYIKRYYFAEARPRLLAELRGPRGRLPARRALGGLHRLDPAPGRGSRGARRPAAGEAPTAASRAK